MTASPGTTLAGMDDYQQVREVLARYVRATDHRDGAAMAALFEPDATVVINFHNAGQPEQLASLSGAEAIGAAVAGMMKPHPPRGWSHHTTHDHIIEVTGDEATMDAQLVVFNSVSLERPATGWPAGTAGAQGTVTPIESGYYRTRLRRTAGRWLIQHHAIDAATPY